MRDSTSDWMRVLMRTTRFCLSRLSRAPPKTSTAAPITVPMLVKLKLIFLYLNGILTEAYNVEGNLQICKNVQKCTDGQLRKAATFI